ncbi:MAG: SUMF1/EgtB/PvdO family nonheme iron enzyme [Acidobacteria bacterium]|nr:SUMF1/EgtB/PvdO family nonheme iron enzyme [Acidobacteriota bacterium]
MYFISWNDAKDFVRRLNEKNDGFEYGLPSEAQWEYAARSGGPAPRPR